jgi:hypothetical protein
MRALQVHKEKKNVIATCYHCGQELVVENATPIPVIQQDKEANETCLAFLCGYCDRIWRQS